MPEVLLVQLRQVKSSVHLVIFTELLSSDCDWRRCYPLGLNAILDHFLEVFPLPSNRLNLSCDDCLEDKSEDYQNRLD